MKRTSLALLTIGLIVGLGNDAQAAASGPHKAIAAPDSAITEKFDVNGLTVILRRNTANAVVVANLYLLGGVRQLTPQTAGIEAMTLAASERGTKRFPGAAVRQRTARLGSRIGLEAND